MFVTPSTLIMTSLLLQAFFPSIFLHFSFLFLPLSLFPLLSVASCCSHCLIIFLNFLLLWIFIGHKPGIQIIYLITFITVFFLSIHFFSFFNSSLFSVYNFFVTKRSWFVLVMRCCILVSLFPSLSSLPSLSVINNSCQVTRWSFDLCRSETRSRKGDSHTDREEWRAWLSMVEEELICQKTKHSWWWWWWYLDCGRKWMDGRREEEESNIYSSLPIYSPPFQC